MYRLNVRTETTNYKNRSLQIFMGLGMNKHNIHTDTDAHTDTHMNNIKITKSKETLFKTNKRTVNTLSENPERKQKSVKQPPPKGNPEISR